MNEDMTCAEHAEAWASENGEKVPVRDSIRWKWMYKRWIDFAFAGM